MAYTLSELRERHPRFFYHGYSIAREEGNLRFSFDLEIEPGIRFAPSVLFQGVDAERVRSLGEEVLNNFAFHLGLMEVPSYWKAACSPEIVVEAGPLDSYQLDWWHNLLLNGQGEFFYTNRIDFTAPDFITIRSASVAAPATAPYSGSLAKRMLVPIGGGKDSAVTCELLKRAGSDITCWALNPIPASLDIIALSGTGEPIIVKRTLDPALLQLNSAGYLNGHTPFSAYLAFAGTASAVLYDYNRIAVSNERSSNEGNVFFLGREVNHQYSKSFDFEERFQDYSRRYLAQNALYFSFLRPLYELQIARIFSQYSRYFSVFRSCNRGQKTNSWCGNCPKCLFAYAILYPFLGADVLKARVFGQDLFEKPELVSIAFELLGRTEAKPFECVGAVEETMAAFYLCVQKAGEQGPLPVVLQRVQADVLAYEADMEARAAAVLHAWNSRHSIPADLEPVISAEIAR